MVDGITMTFEVENNSEEATVSADALDDELAPIVDGAAATAASIPAQRTKPKPRDLSSIDAPILQLAEAMATAGRADEARRLLATLPGLAEAKATLVYQFA